MKVHLVGCDTSAVADWLMQGARSAPQPKDVMGQMCERMVASGVPLWRAAVFVRTLHPQVTGRRFLWRQGGGVEVGELQYERLDTEEYRDSPVVRVYATMKPLRRRLRQESDAADFEVLRSLYAEGTTDYLASPLLFVDGTIHVATWATKRPGGFSDEHIAAIESVVAPLARVAEIMALHRTAINLLDTYVGRHAGERILSGQIRRGHTESILAAIWLSDMRGFTALADSVSPETLISLLNRYFDCQVPTIVEHGGEVLKFIGDGLLAIFPVDGERSLSAVCDAALAAADTVRSNIACLGASSDIDGTGSLRFGLALHVGEVLYGNIGGGNRLDFTCIGPAVNLAARLETLAGRLGRTMVVSEAFAQRARVALLPLGAFVLPGFALEQTVFGDIEEKARIPLDPPSADSPLSNPQ